MSSLLVADSVFFSAGTVLDADALGIRDGRIVAVGSRRAVRDELGSVDDELGTALDAYTRGSADLLGIGPGTLVPGAPADLAIADRDPFAGPAVDIHETRTKASVVAGEVVAL